MKRPTFLLQGVQLGKERREVDHDARTNETGAARVDKTWRGGTGGGAKEGGGGGGMNSC